MTTPLFALPDVLLIPTVQMALSEDLGRRGDITSMAVIDKDSTANLAIVSRDDGVLAGNRDGAWRHAVFAALA